MLLCRAEDFAQVGYQVAALTGWQPAGDEGASAVPSAQCAYGYAENFCGLADRYEFVWVVMTIAHGWRQ